METCGCGHQRARLCVPRCYRERTGKSYQRFTEKVVFSLVFFLLVFLSCFSTRLGSHLARFLSGFGPRSFLVGSGGCGDCVGLKKVEKSRLV